MNKIIDDNKGINVLSLFDGISVGRIALEIAKIKVNNYYSSEIKEEALKVTADNYPQDIINRLGDITKLDTNNLPKIDLLIGGSPCFVVGTKVITSTGYKNIEDIKVGDEVLTHTNNFRKVLKIGGQLSDTFIIEAQGIKTTETTEEHPYYVRSKTKVWNNSKRTYDWEFSEPKWVKAKDLKKYDLLGIPINNKAENPLNLTEEECYILGRYIADGHTNSHKKTEKGREHNRVYKLILSVGINKINIIKSKIKENNYTYNLHTTSCSRFTFSNKRLVEIAEKYCGCGASNKVIPQIFINLPKQLLSKVLEGYMDGDGCYTNNCFKGSSISQELIMSLSLVVGKVYGTNCLFSHFKRPPTCVIEGRTVNQQDSYTCAFRKTETKQGKSYTINNIIWLPFRKSYEGNKQVQVYNLEVDIDNSYTANNAIVHNCTDLSSANKHRLGLEGKKSGLFYEYLRILKEVNPTYFLLENVRMKKDQQDIITELLARYLYPEDEWERIY